MARLLPKVSVMRLASFALMGGELAEITVRPEAKRLGDPVLLTVPGE